VANPGLALVSCSAMGLLDKTNPHATRASVIRSLIGGSVIGPVVGLMAWPGPYCGPVWPAIVPVGAILGAAIGALLEWQVDDGGDKPDDEERAAACDT
jgi:hypothetical protein